MQYVVLLAIGILDIVVVCAALFAGRMTAHQQCCNFGSSVVIFVTSLCGFEFITLREEAPIASQRLSFPGNIYFAAFFTLIAGMALLAKQTDHILMGDNNLNLAEMEEDETQQTEGEVGSTGESDEDEVQVMPMWSE